MVGRSANEGYDADDRSDRTCRAHRTRATRRIPARARRKSSVRGGRDPRSRHPSRRRKRPAHRHDRLWRHREYGGRDRRRGAGRSHRDVGAADRRCVPDGSQGRPGPGHRAQAGRADQRPLRGHCRDDRAEPDVSRAWQRAVLALGSNLGDRHGMLQGGVDALAKVPGVDVVAVSGVYETAPVGGPPGQDPYLNAVIVVDTTLPASVLLERCLAVEALFGRRRTERWGPRTLDIDVITYDDQVSADETLTLPHPRASERAFVLLPWLSIDQGATLPGLGRVAELAAARRPDGVVMQTDLRLEVPDGG